MIEVLDCTSDRVFAMRVSGKILHQDYQRFIPLVEKQIETRGSVRCYIEMVDFHGIELRALWDEIKFDVRHAWQIEHCAIVGDRAWEAWMTRLSRPLFARADICFFDVGERDKAWEWIYPKKRGDSDQSSPLPRRGEGCGEGQS